MRFILFLLSFTAFATDGPTDGLGCHLSKAGTYHCHTGPLAGRAFKSKDAAVRALTILSDEGDVRTPATEPKSAEAKAADVKAADSKPSDPKAPMSVEATTSTMLQTNDSEPMAAANVENKQEVFNEAESIKLMVWNASKLIKSNADFHQISNLIALSDLVVFKGLSATEIGTHGLKSIQDALYAETGEHICVALQTPVKGKQTRTGYLWKQRKLSLVGNGGLIVETCPAGLTKFDHKFGSATFYLRDLKKLFIVSPVDVDLEASDFAKTLGSSNWPVVVVGEFKKGTNTGLKPTIDTAKSSAFRSLSRGFVKSEENIWVRNLKTLDTRAVDLAAEYPDLDTYIMRDRFSDRCPLYGVLGFASGEP